MVISPNQLGTVLANLSKGQTLGPFISQAINSTWHLDPITRMHSMK